MRLKEVEAMTDRWVPSKGMTVEFGMFAAPVQVDVSAFNDDTNYTMSLGDLDDPTKLRATAPVRICGKNAFPCVRRRYVDNIPRRVIWRPRQERPRHFNDYLRTSAPSRVARQCSRILLVSCSARRSASRTAS